MHSEWLCVYLTQPKSHFLGPVEQGSQIHAAIFAGNIDEDGSQKFHLRMKRAEVGEAECPLQGLAAMPCGHDEPVPRDVAAGKILNVGLIDVIMPQHTFHPPRRHAQASLIDDPTADLLPPFIIDRFSDHEDCKKGVGFQRRG